jgi:hypothetical protein
MENSSIHPFLFQTIHSYFISLKISNSIDPNDSTHFIQVKSQLNIQGYFASKICLETEITGI